MTKQRWPRLGQPRPLERRSRMTSQRKLELDLLHADLAAVNDLLGRLSEEDVMARMGLEDRSQELKALILAAEEEKEKLTASATLFFGGKPVTGMRGIESKFATSAVATFQDLVAMVLAHKSNSLSPRGAIANRDSSTLYITSLARGSVGFILEEMRPQANLTDTPLTEAVNEATELLEAFGTSNEEYFQEWLEATDQRVLGSAGKLFDLLRRSEATLRLVTEDSDYTFGVQAVARAAERAKSTTTRGEKQTVIGQLAGVLPDARRFEFRRDDTGDVIAGKIASSLDSHTLARTAEEWLNIDAEARIVVRRVYHNDDLVRESYTLFALTPLAGPHN